MLPADQATTGRRTWMLFIGDDWAEDHHDVELVDDSGGKLAAARLPEGMEGITKLHELIATHQHPPAPPPPPQPGPGPGPRTLTGHRRVRSTRRVAHAVIILAAVNICLNLAALTLHLPALAAWGTGTALTLITATFLLARHVSRPARGRTIGRPG